MTGIQFVTDEKGRKVGVLIDLKKHRAVWEDFSDGLISESRRKEKGIPYEQYRATRLNVPVSVVKHRSRSSGLELAHQPRTVGCKKLKGYNDRWRVRVGSWRVVYRRRCEASQCDARWTPPRGIQMRSNPPQRPGTHTS